MEAKNLILYADDDGDDRDMLESIFSSHSGYRFRTFPDGQALLDYIDGGEKNQICLIVLDINMPRLGGIETLRQLRQDIQLVDLPVIVFTTSSSPGDRISAESLGASVFTKPNSLAEIAEVGQKMLALCTGE
ncbi:response regulator [Flaviaesturariibacter amylovorans]|uniref:Response regulatory domain-containing protein n=1 Tax=Flaviaesturariibacter amylovorans TaxID=1084520 RepID=A0ABP8HI70_9BACT